MIRLRLPYVCALLAALVCAAGLWGCAEIPEKANEDLRQVLLRERFQTAWFLCARGKTKEAAPELETLYNEMKAEDDIAPRVIFWLGYCYEENGEHQAAINKYYEVAGR